MEPRGSARMKSFFLSLLLLVGLVAAVTSTAHATGNVYYVGPTGSDGNLGTLAAPWRTVLKGLTSLSAGDTLYLRGGTYAERIMSPALAPGTPTSPITVAAYPGERPVIQGLLWISGAMYWHFDGVNVTWDPATGQSYEHMVKFTNGAGWTFENAEVWGAHSYADFYVAGTIVGQPTAWTVSNNCIHDAYPTNSQNQDQLMYVNSGTGTQTGTITRNLFFNGTNGWGIKLAGSSPGAYDSSGVSVTYNTVYNTGASNLMAGWSSRNNTIDHNIFDVTASNANIRGYDLGDPSGGTNNVDSDNLGYGASAGLVQEYPLGSQQWADGGGNVFQTDPQFDTTGSCSGFHPQNPAAQAFGVYALGDPTPSPSPSPSPSPTPSPSASVSPSPSPTQTFSATIQFVSSSGAANDSATSLTLPRPAGVLAGDVMIAAVDVRGNPTITPPTGWTLIRIDKNGTVIWEASYYRVTTGAEPSSYTWNFSNVQPAAGGIVGYRGVDPTGPVLGSSGQITSVTTNAIAAPSVITPVGSMVVGLFGIAVNTTIASPANLFERLEAVSSAGKYKATFEYSDGLRLVDGSSGIQVALAAKGAFNVGQLIVLKPTG